MPTREHILDMIATHCRAENDLDKDTYIALFANDVVIEDPVGVNTTTGIAAVASDFWASVLNAEPKLKQLHDPIICGNEAIAFIEAEINHDGGRVTISPIVVNFVYNEAGKVCRLRSFMNYG
jgi:steroid delta-isomerase